MWPRVREAASAVRTWSAGSGPLRLRVWLRRHPNLVMAAVLGTGILFMVLHWGR